MGLVCAPRLRSASILPHSETTPRRPWVRTPAGGAGLPVRFATPAARYPPEAPFPVLFAPRAARRPTGVGESGPRRGEDDVALAGAQSVRQLVDGEEAGLDDLDTVDVRLLITDQLADHTDLHA